MISAHTMLDALVCALRDSAAHDPGVEDRPIAVLWTDPGKDWQPIIGQLVEVIPELLVMGDYAPDKRTGPVIWLKCVVSGRIPEMKIPQDLAPVLYLPGVARHQLRQADQCPWHLQPLVELLYRGTAWTHRNGRDWTLEAFLESEDGLGLDVAGDERTRSSLHAALTALAKTPLSSLRSQRLEATDFDAVVVGDTKRDMLAWIAAGSAVRTEWGEERWHAFRSRCRDEFDIDPEKEAPLSAAEKLGNRKTTAWKQVWDRFAENPKVYGGVREALHRAQPTDQLALDAEPWPGMNRSQEIELRKALENLAGKAPHQARQHLAELEKQHGVRRDWVWARMGEAPLACAIAALHRLAEATRTVPACENTDGFVRWYAETGWIADAALLAALQGIEDHEHEKAIQTAVRAVYAPWLEEASNRFLSLVAKTGYSASDGVKAKEGECLVFADGLRFDVGQELAQRLGEAGLNVDSDIRLAALPTVTPTAKPAVAPVAEHCHGSKLPAEFRPLDAEDREITPHVFVKLLENAGYQLLTDSESLAPQTAASRGWMETGRLDSRGHMIGAELARSVPDELRRVTSLVERLLEAGWNSVRIITDHGWLLLPGGLEKHDLPAFLVESRWSRCATIKGQSRPDVPVVPWHWNRAEHVAVAPGAKAFRKGEAYAHGGVSPQECVIPVLHVSSGERQPGSIPRIANVRWRRMRCTVELETPHSGLRADVRRSAGDPDTSVVATVKEIESDGHVSLLVQNEDLDGQNVTVVVLDNSGNVVAMQETCIGR